MPLWQARCRMILLAFLRPHLSFPRQGLASIIMVLLKNKTRIASLFGDFNPLPFLVWRNLFLICSREACYHKSWVYCGLGPLERKAWKICKAHLSFFQPISSLRQLSSKHTTCLNFVKQHKVTRRDDSLIPQNTIKPHMHYTFQIVW